MMPSGVRPSIRLASSPMPRMFPAWSTAATEGSFRTTPSPFTKISVLAVPRSTASSLAGRQVFLLASCPRRAKALLRKASAMAAGLVPIATVTVLVSLLLWRLGPVNELGWPCRYPRRLRFTGRLRLAPIGHFYSVKSDVVRVRGEPLFSQPQLRSYP